jgi:hypothetical protein
MLIVIIPEGTEGGILEAFGQLFPIILPYTICLLMASIKFTKILKD